jgi:hypothetical protein
MLGLGNVGETRQSERAMIDPDESDAMAESIPMPPIRLPSAERKIHVPRVAEITGRAPVSQQQAEREWQKTKSGEVAFAPSFGKPRKAKPKQQSKRAKTSLNTTVLREQRRPKRWHDYNG